MNHFLPINKAEAENLGWHELDFIIISGDAYIDHHSFGAAIIGRILESKGYRVGIIPQPDWHSVDDFRKLGKPKLGFLVTSGNLDSMVNHYTANRKLRSEDAYSPGGKAGCRPDRAVIVYASRVREAYKGIPVILGGLEASLRRMSHYDYWSDKLRRSVLIDAKADLLVYGMGERAILEIADRLAAGESIKDLRNIMGTCYKVTRESDLPPDKIDLPSYDELIKDKKLFADSFNTQLKNTDPYTGKVLVEENNNQWLVQNPPAKPLSSEELDAIYELPFCYDAHPVYRDMGGVPALKEVLFSITSNRGCFGGCNFCSLAFHQGRIVTARTEDSLIREAERMTKREGFKGYIHDVGGPTANFQQPACRKQLSKGVCPERQCLFPDPCPNIEVSHEKYVSLLRKIRKLPGVKKVFIRSGIRFDYLMADKDRTFFKELCSHHVSGQLKVAPEHVAPRVLQAMGKPEHSVYTRFTDEFKKINREIGKNQYIIPYFISAHPGSSLKEAVVLAEYLKSQKFIPDQVQDFYPTPGTMSTCMYFTEVDPRNGSSIYIPKKGRERRLQRALLQFNKPENRDLVEEALEKAGRMDLIGTGFDCLIKSGGSLRRTVGKRNKSYYRKNRDKT